MKRIIALITATVLIISLTGCTDISYLEIQKRLIVQGIGFDRTDGGGIKLSVQALNTENTSGNSGDSAGSELVKNYTVEGITLADCIEKLKALTGKTPLLSQNRLVIFSLDCARSGISTLIDNFLRNNENRFNVPAAVSLNSAEEIIRADLGENTVPSRLIEQAIKCSGPETAKTSIISIINCLADGNKSPVLPVLRLENNDNGDELKIASCAVFKGDRLKFIKDNEIQTGISFLNGRVSSGKLSFEGSHGEKISLDIIKSKTKIKVELTHGVPTFSIKIYTKLTVTEISGSALKKETLSDIAALSLEAQTEIKKIVQSALSECIIEGTADICGLTRYLWRKFPDYYRANEENADKILSASEYDISVFVDILRAGDSAITL